MKPSLISLHPRMTERMGGSRFVHEVFVRLARRYRVHLEVADGVAPLLGEDTMPASGMFQVDRVARHLAQSHVQVVNERSAMFHHVSLRSSYTSPLSRLFSRLVAAPHKHREMEATAAADVVQVLSESERGNVQRVHGADAAVIYEGVDVEHFHPLDNDELRALTIIRRTTEIRDFYLGVFQGVWRCTRSRSTPGRWGGSPTSGPTTPTPWPNSRPSGACGTADICTLSIFSPATPT